MEQMEGKTESLEMVDENPRWLIVEFKIFLLQLFYFLVKGRDGIDGG
jgi:hypothetical protein